VIVLDKKNYCKKILYKLAKLFTDRIDKEIQLSRISNVMLNITLFTTVLEEDRSFCSGTNFIAKRIFIYLNRSH